MQKETEFAIREGFETDNPIYHRMAQGIHSILCIICSISVYNYNVIHKIIFLHIMLLKMKANHTIYSCQFFRYKLSNQNIQKWTKWTFLQSASKTIWIVLNFASMNAVQTYHLRGLCHRGWGCGFGSSLNLHCLCLDRYGLLNFFNDNLPGCLFYISFLIFLLFLFLLPLLINMKLSN